MATNVKEKQIKFEKRKGGTNSRVLLNCQLKVGTLAKHIFSKVKMLFLFLFIKAYIFKLL